MSESKFGYNAFSQHGMFLWLIMALVLAVITYPNYVYLFIGIYVLLILGGIVLKRRTFLLINDKGIEVNYLLKGKRQASWNEIGGLINEVIVGSGKWKKEGWGILGRGDAATDSNGFVLFIPESYIAASNRDVNDALKRGFRQYVEHERLWASYELDREHTDPRERILWGVFAACIVINVYLFNWFYSSENEDVIRHTIIHGELYGSINHWVELLWIFAFASFSCYTPSCLIKTHLKEALIWSTGVMAVVLGIAYFYLPDRKLVYENYAEATNTVPIKLQTVVKENVRGKGKKDPGYMAFDLTYDGKDYQLKTAYVPGIEENMPLTVFVRKGARDLPIITSMAIIPSIWSVIYDKDNENAMDHETAKELNERQNKLRDLEQIEIPVETEATEAVAGEGNSIDMVEQLPEFPGGTEALAKWMNENLKYPAAAEEDSIQGRVLCQFTIECDGSISNVHVLLSVDPLLDQEAERVIKMMPKWKPGMQNGKPIRVKYVVPITFRLH